MATGKAKHDPNKQQNRYGAECPYYEEYPTNPPSCEGGYGDIKVCKGNRHNCVKVKYKKLAIKKQ